MFRQTSLTGGVLIALALSFGSTHYAQGEPNRRDPSDASQLVHAALEAELCGDYARRNSLLQQATDFSPDYPPARWQSGQVRFDGSWMKVEDVHRLLSQDARWHEYERFRAELGDGLYDQIELAEWCARNGLDDEEQYHWRNVLAMAPDHRRARGRLGVREYEGALLTDDEIRELRSREKQAKQAYDKYAPILKSLRQDATARDAVLREKALSAIAAIDDPLAIETLCSLLTVDDADKRRLTHKHGADGAEAIAQELECAVVSALGRMRQHESTLTLLNYAVFASRPEVRARAAEQLKSRPKTDFVPLLMSQLAAPIDADIRVYATRDGAVRVRKELFQAGPEAHKRLIDSDTLVTIVRSERRNAYAIHNSKMAQNWVRATNAAKATRAQVNLVNAQTEQRNSRILQVLATTTGMDYGNDVEAWWKAWQSYNDLYAEETPIYEQVYSNVAYDYVPIYSCFVAGTPVWTKAGLKAIDQIKVGDQVLAQDPTTGELTYRFVLKTTVRPPTPVFRLVVGDEEILTTRGHRFWVDGLGWQMVGLLQPPMNLHGVDGAASLASVDEVDRLEVFNLVVEDFHTYFVGKQKLLVHDNHCPRPVLGPIPGMSRLERQDATITQSR